MPIAQNRISSMQNLAHTIVQLQRHWTGQALVYMPFTSLPEVPERPATPTPKPTIKIPSYLRMGVRLLFPYAMFYSPNSLWSRLPTQSGPLCSRPSGIEASQKIFKVNLYFPIETTSKAWHFKHVIASSHYLDDPQGH